MGPKGTVTFTKHAETMLKERNFTKDEIVSVIKNPDWKEEIEDDVWHAFRRSSNKVLRVVVRGKEESYTVITMFYDKRLRNRL
jgi:spore maturation protein CgeB